MGVLDVTNGCSRVIACHMTLKQQRSLFLCTWHEFKLRTSHFVSRSVLSVNFEVNVCAHMYAG